jgi:hypothetical protein
VTVANAPGTIDADYRGELKVLLINLGEEDFMIRRGDRIAQLVIAPIVQAAWREVGSLDATDRGARRLWIHRRALRPHERRNPMELILVRHGRPARMETTSDPHLNEVGLEQARRAAAWLALEPIDATWSSTMLRAVQTAEAFAGLVGHGIQRHPGIVEFDRNSGVYIRNRGAQEGELRGLAGHGHRRPRRGYG